MSEQIIILYYNSWFLEWQTEFSLEYIYYLWEFLLLLCWLFNTFWSCFWIFFLKFLLPLWPLFCTFALLFVAKYLSCVFATAALSTCLISPFPVLLDKLRQNLLLGLYPQLIHWSIYWTGVNELLHIFPVSVIGFPSNKQTASWCIITFYKPVQKYMLFVNITIL